MIRINRAALAALVPLIVAGTACSAGTLAGLATPATRERAVGLDHQPAADAAPTTQPVATVPAPTTPGATVAPSTAPVPTVVAPVPTVVAPIPTVVAPVPTVAQTFTTLRDETGMLTVDVPTTWSDIDTREFVNNDGTLRPGITASPDLELFDDTWSTPGLLYTAYAFQPDANVLFARYDYTNNCTDGGFAPYNDGVFVGNTRTFLECGNSGSENYVLVVNPPGNTVTVVIVVQTVTEADTAAYQHILETFNIDPNVGMPTETVPPPTSSAVPTTGGSPITTSALPTVPVPTIPVPTVPVPTIPVPTGPTVPPATVPVPTIAAPGTTVFTPSPTTLSSAPVSTAFPQPATTVAASGAFRVVTDASGRLSVQAPVSWVDVDGDPSSEGAVPVAALSVAPDLALFRDTYNGPGLLLHETPYVPDPASELASRALTNLCTDGGIQPNPNPNFTGSYQAWLDCDGTLSDLYILVANPIDGRQVTVVLVVQVVSDADTAALQTALMTYTLNAAA